MGLRAVLVALVAGIAIMFFLQQDADSSRLSAADSAGTRLRYATDSLPVTLDHLGIGGVSDSKYMKVVGSGHFPEPSFHNTYLSILASSGVLGFAAFVGLQAVSLRRFASRAAICAFVVLNALWVSTGALIGLGLTAVLAARRSDVY